MMVDAPADWYTNEELVDYVLSETVQPVLVGTFLSCIALGLVLALSGQYFFLYGRDKRSNRILVLVALLISIVDTVWGCHWAATWACKDVGDVRKIFVMPDGLRVYAILTTLSVLLTHFFFLSRLYTISFHQHKRPLRPRIIVGTLTLAAIATCGLGLYCTIELFKAEWLLAVFGLWKEITAFASLTMAVDFGISIGTVYYLIVKPKREGAGLIKQNSLFTTIAMRSVQSNAVALVVQITLLVLVQTNRDGATFMIIGALQPKAYLCSIIATLLSRPPPTRPLTLPTASTSTLDATADGRVLTSDRPAAFGLLSMLDGRTHSSGRRRMDEEEGKMERSGSREMELDLPPFLGSGVLENGDAEKDMGVTSVREPRRAGGL